MDICVADLETYWTTTHSLSKMPALEYCMHPETEVISCSFKWVRDGVEAPAFVIFGEQEVARYCAETAWSNTFVIGHNLSEFDVIILAWRLKVNPKIWGCTQAMARPHHAKNPGLSLAKLATYYNLGAKDSAALINTKGKHLKDFTPEELRDMEVYNAEDSELCYRLFKVLAPMTRRDEIRLIDMTIRMLVEPQFDADTALLRKTLHDEVTRKHTVLTETALLMGIQTEGLAGEEIQEAARTVLASSHKFANYLKTLGVEVPMKPSPKTGKPIPALAKTDQAFLDLQEHENPAVAIAAQARLDIRSTILQTRIQAFLTAASVAKGKLPIPLRYCGADTTWRWSGWSYNPQNLPRINSKQPKLSDALRMSLRAPEGCKILVADYSSIELRVNHFLWKELDSMQLFKNDPGGADLYAEFAGDTLYGVPVSLVSDVQRQVGKMAQLGLGFGAAWKTFQQVAKIMGGVDLSDEEAQRIVLAWRARYTRIVRGWKRCHATLPGIVAGATGAAVDPWGMVVPMKGGLKTPKGFISYPHLRSEVSQETGRQEFVYGLGRQKARIYAGKIDENIVQHLARSVLSDHVVDIQKNTGYCPALLVHDEPVYVAPEDEIEDLQKVVDQVMRTPPLWWPELIVWSKSGIADVYGEAK